nr:KAT8 regulatory NSL complex subunit 3 [Onthophagus taurus]
MSHKEYDLNSIYMDHCYSRPHNHVLESRFLRPTKTLFISHKSNRKSTNPLAPQQDVDDVIDVDGLPNDPPIIYDTTKAKYLMGECERHALFARPRDDDIEGWEDKITRINWLPSHIRLFNSTVDILNSDYMSRLAATGVFNEPIVRRNTIHRSVSRFRQLMCSVSWDIKLTQWLHILLVDHLPSTYLGIYLDILQTLKSKCPIFVDKLLFGTATSSRMGATSNESLFSLLKRPWDPVAFHLNQDKPKKLPGNPIIIVIPAMPTTTSSNNQFKRLQRWIGLLSNLATVIPVYTNIGANGHRTTMTNCLDQMLATTRARIQEIKDEFPGRSLILAGYNAGASLALQVAQVESVLCVLCLGFSLLTAEGKRGDPDDNLLELQCPVLFVIGQCSNTSLQEDMEDLRERMRVETGLIVVGSADDYLRVNKKKKREESITQGVVDRCIGDEIGEFVSGLLLSPYPPQIRLSPSHINDTNKSPNSDRRRNNSNCSSIDSEPSSPRITRPGMIPHSHRLNPASISINKQTGPEIRVLEDVVLNAGAGKFINAGREIDISKITLLGSSANVHPHSTITPTMSIMDCKNKCFNPPQKEMGKYITSKKQLLSNKVPKPIKKLPYITPNQQQPNSLQPATNLSSQDIMNLPIIFADDNQMLTNNVIQPNDPSQNLGSYTVTKPGNSGKIVFINKQQLPLTTSFPSATIKRPAAPPVPIRTNANSVKYAKIILSKRVAAEDGKKNDNQMHDIESQLVATSLPNPKFVKTDFSEEIKKRLGDSIEENVSKIFKSE